MYIAYFLKFIRSCTHTKIIYQVALFVNNLKFYWVDWINPTYNQHHAEDTCLSRCSKCFAIPSQILSDIWILAKTCKGIQMITYHVGTFHFLSTTPPHPPPSPPPQDGMFLPRRVRMFFKEANKIWTLWIFFQRCRQKINPSDFIFQGVPRINWGFEFLPSLLGGGGGVQCG